jgi:hypothetical protein
MTTTNHTLVDRAQERARLIDQFKNRYGSFESEHYLQNERNYKLRLAEYVRDNLGKEQLAELIDRNAYEKAARLIRRTYQRPENNLLSTWNRLPLENAPDEALA